ncbi:hypothetical protein TRIATDRAFT_298200 [Trichoderma atroviride IMI 206040]|uniref:Uncharacterized protein n=1 Tax=Hypocrea atroviridis (strain ATCC 20476 / IMI 206040) TaxID=452589 RepID=G9NM23_HYPAI|nr:uncharacterized protein TRIATDRAFT_298200 [Trichoderma atroviride IMI 206040]EHK47956.1 hypothetical protein TRIATDRAFT_298200 [Trichoderma atroviride IMI 206040]
MAACCLSPVRAFHENFPGASACLTHKTTRTRVYVVAKLGAAGDISPLLISTWHLENLENYLGDRRSCLLAHRRPAEILFHVEQYETVAKLT